MNELRYGRGELGDPDVAGRREWRVSNGIGGFAAGTASGELSRYRHGLLSAALAGADTPTLLLAKFSATLELRDQRWALDTSRWSSGARDPQGYLNLESFGLEDGIPLWVWAMSGVRLEQRIWMEQGENTTYIQYRLRATPEPARLRLHVLVNHRPADAAAGRGLWTARVEPATGGLRIEAFEGATPLWLLAPSAEILPRHDWHRDFLLAREGSTAAPAHEDHLLAAELVIKLKAGEETTLVASTRRDAGAGEAGPLALVSALSRRAAHERGLLEGWRHAQPTVARQAPSWMRSLVLAADGLLADHPPGSLVSQPGLVPGMGTSGDFTRDTLIALPGLTLSTGRPERAKEILERLSSAIDASVAVDAPAGAAAPDIALWYVQAVRAYFEHTIDTAFLSRVFPVLESALDAMERGTRGGLSSDPSDGLLRAGEGDIDATWMDRRLRLAGLPPRHGKAVELNALWYNAHTAMTGFARRLRRPVERWESRATRIEAGFARFWNPASSCLFDVLDGPFGTDASIRPNQLFAVSLPDSPLSAPQRRSVLARCVRDLLTSHGVRSLSSADPRYLGHETGDALQVARAAVLGSAWTWLLPVLATAHGRIVGDRAVALEFIEPLNSLMRDCGPAMLPDRSDGEAPYAPRGGFEGAWPVAETLRAFHSITGVRRDLRRREMTRARSVATADL